MKIKILEYLFFGGRTVEHKIEDVVCIKTLEFVEPKAINDYKFVGYDYPTVKKQGCFAVCLKDGTTEFYPASNWQIEF